MVIDEARDMLRAAMEAGAALRDLERQRERCIDMIGGSGMHFGAGAMTKSRRSMTEEIAVRLADLDSDIQAEELHYLEMIDRARMVISHIRKGPHKRVLTLRYLCGMAWPDISSEMGYADPKSVYRVHGWALQEAQKVLDFERTMRQ